MQNDEIAITVKGKDLSEVATRMLALALQFSEEPTPKKGRGKKLSKKEIEDTELEADDVIEDEDADVEDLSDDEEVEESEEVEEDEDLDESGDDEEPAKVDAKQLATLKKALNTYSGKHGKDKAVKILHKFAKVSQDVKADDYSKLMKALKV